MLVAIILGLPQWLSGKESTCNSGAAENVGSIPGSGRSPEGGHGNLLPVFLPGESQGCWWAGVHGVAKSQTRLKRLSMHVCFYFK